MDPKMNMKPGSPDANKARFAKAIVADQTPQAKPQAQDPQEAEKKGIDDLAQLLDQCEQAMQHGDMGTCSQAMGEMKKIVAELKSAEESEDQEEQGEPDEAQA